MEEGTTFKPITLGEVENIMRIYSTNPPFVGDDFLDVKKFESRVRKSKLEDGVLNKILSKIDYFEHIAEELPLNRNLTSIEFASVLYYAERVEKKYFSDSFFSHYVSHPHAVDSLLHIRTIFDIAHKKGTELGIKTMVSQLVKHEKIVLDKATFDHIFYNVTAPPTSYTHMVIKNKDIMSYDQIQKKVEKKYGTFIQSK